MEIIHILVYNMLPLIGIAALGYWLDSMFPIDVKSLTKLTFYIILPSFIFRSIFLMPFDTGMMVLFAAGALLFLLHSLFATGVAKLRGYDSGMREAFRIGTMFSNCGNVGVSMITLIYSNPPFTKGLEAPYHDAAMAAITVLLILMNSSDGFHGGEIIAVHRDGDAGYSAAPHDIDLVQPRCVARDFYPPDPRSPLCAGDYLRVRSFRSADLAGVFDFLRRAERRQQRHVRRRLRQLSRLCHASRHARVRHELFHADDSDLSGALSLSHTDVVRRIKKDRFT